MPVPDDLGAEGPDCRRSWVRRNTPCGRAPRCHPPPLHRHGQVPALLELVFDLFQLGPHPLRDADPPEQERPDLAFPQMCVKPRKSNVSGFPRPASAGSRRRTARTRSAASCRGAAPGRTSRTARGARPGTARVSLMLEPHDEVVGEAHDDHLTARAGSSTSRPTGRGRSAGTRSPAAAIPMPLMSSAGLCAALARSAWWGPDRRASAAHNSSLMRWLTGWRAS